MVWPFNRGRKTNSSAAELPNTEFSLSQYIIIGAFVFIGVMLLIHIITLETVILSTNNRNATALKNVIDAVDTSNQTIFNILLPVFGAWVGVVVAFYFGSQREKRSQEALVKALSPEQEKLSTIKVQDLLTKFTNTKNIQKVTMDKKVSDVIASFGNFSDVLVVKEDLPDIPIPLGILYKADLFSPFAKTSDSLDDYKGTLRQVMSDHTVTDFITKRKWDPEKGVDNFATVTADDNLWQARQMMYKVSIQINDVRCVVTDPSTGKADAIFSYDSIAAFLK